MKIICADHVLPVSAPPITGGAVAIEGTEIAAVGNAADLAERYPHAEIENMGEAAIIPGLVNCHSHLEITAMRGLLDAVESDFRAWLLKLNNTRSGLSEAEIETAAIAGAVEGARAGVTFFADVGRTAKAALASLKTVGLRGIVYQETEFSPDSRTADDDLEKLREKFLEVRENASELVEAGISPHSPYTVSRRLFEKIAALAAGENIKLSIHAAESLQEENLLRYGEGFFIEVFAKFGLQWTSPKSSPIEFLARTGILEARPLLVHCVNVSAADIGAIEASGSGIAHCPRSNAKFGHGVAPLEAFLDAGIPAGLGSDSVASNNVCDLLEEACFAALAARNRADKKRFITAADVLYAATLGGARAVGYDGRIGSLEAGKQADLAIVSLAGISQLPVNDVAAALVFSSNARDVRSTIVAGREVFREGRVTAVDEQELALALRSIAAKFA